MKKFLSLLLALAMLILPAAAFAEMGTATTITFRLDIPTAMEREMRGAADLYNVLGIRLESGSTTGSLQLQLSGETVINIDACVQPDAILLKSNLIGTQTIGVTKTDIGELLNAVVGAQYDVDFAALMPYVGLDELLPIMTAGMDIDAAAVMAEAFPEIQAVVSSWIDRTPVQYGSVNIAGADPIVSYRLVTVSAEDLQDLLAAFKVTAATNASFREGYALSGGNINDLLTILDELSAQVPQLYQMIDAPALEFGYNEAGELVYTRVAVSVPGSNETIVVLSTVLHDGAATTWTYALGVDGLEMYMFIEEAPCTAPAKFTADANTVYPLQMTGSELTSWSQQIENDAMMVLYSLIMKLPNSTLQMIMGGY